MKVGVAGETLAGRAIDLRAVQERHGVDFDPSEVASVIRGDSGMETECSLAIDCPDPGPAHSYVGVIRAGATVPLRAALAAAARSRGHAAPQDEELAEIRDRLDALDAPEIDLEHARRRVADASDVEERLRERVATLQGRVRALRETSGDGGEKVDDAETELAETTRRLSEVETERIAAEQALARARERAQSNRADRRERLRLQDRADNLRRAARERLADRVSDAFGDACDSLPHGDHGDPVRDALAVAHVAELDAPVVLTREADPFESADAAARWLDAGVLRV